MHEHIRDEYDHNGSDYWSDYWKGTGVYPSSNAKHYGSQGGPARFLRDTHLDGFPLPTTML